MDRLWAMEVFVRVAECGSFSRAAESMDVSNGTVTNSLRNLERHLQVTLIDRDTRRLRLTEEGETFLRHAREVLHAVARTEEETRLQAGKLRGRIHVETFISLGHALLCPRLPEFARRYPSITLAVMLTNQPHNMFERAIDVAIRVDKVEDDDLVARPLRDCRFVLCCTPEFASTLPADPRHLDVRSCMGIVPEERLLPDLWHLCRDDERVEIRPEGPLYYNTATDALAAARAGLGVACVLDVIAEPWLADGSVLQVYPEWETRSKTLYVVMPKSRVGSAKVKAFTDFLFEVAETQQRPAARGLVGVKSRGRR